MRNYLLRIEREGVQKVKMFVVITAAYVIFWGPLFFVTLVQHPLSGNHSDYEVINLKPFYFIAIILDFEINALKSPTIALVVAFKRTENRNLASDIQQSFRLWSDNLKLFYFIAIIQDYELNALKKPTNVHITVLKCTGDQNLASDIW